VQHFQTRPTQWVQWDAGIWSKRAQTGRIEISFATDISGNPIYDVIAYDEFENRSDALTQPVVYRDFAAAKQAGDRLAERCGYNAKVA
jgi:hypothetical protein